MKQVYLQFYHQLVDAVSDPHTCQSLTAQLHSTTLMSQEKIAQLSSSQTSGSEFLKVLGVEEEPHLLTVLMEKMAGVKSLQTLAGLMSAHLCELKQGMDNLGRDKLGEIFCQVDVCFSSSLKLTYTHLYVVLIMPWWVEPQRHTVVGLYVCVSVCL